MKRKVAIAMSGGVDSGVAVALVVKSGYQAAGFHMKLWQEPVSSAQRPVLKIRTLLVQTRPSSISAVRPRVWRRLGKQPTSLAFLFILLALKKFSRKEWLITFWKSMRPGGHQILA